MNRKILLSLTAATAAFGAAAAQDETVAITNAQLHMTSADGDVLDGATLLMRNGRITAVGVGVTVPDGARVIDAEGNPVTPGFFNPLTSIGLSEVGAVRESNDTRADNDEFTAALRAEDAFNEDSSVIDVTRAGGITRAYVNPAAGETQFGGCGLVMAMVRGQDAIMEPCAAQAALMGNAGAGRTGGSRTAAFATLRRALSDAQAYADDPEGYAARDDDGRLSTEDAAALVPVATGTMKLHIAVQGAPDIRRVLDMAEAMGLDIILVGAAEAHRVADEIAEAGVPVIVDPMQNLPGSFESMGARQANAAKLAQAGVDVMLSAGDTHNARLMPQLAGNAVRAGMDPVAAMRGVTVIPAEVYGVSDALGTLERGKLADVVIWGGDPFEVTVRPRMVFVEGEETSLENRQTKLAERYRDLTRGERPFQYRH